MHVLQVLVVELQVHGCRAHRSVPQDLLQSPDIDTVPDHVDGVGMPTAMGVHMLADEHPIPLDKLLGPLLGYGKDARFARDVVASHIVAQAANWFVYLC